MNFEKLKECLHHIVVDYHTPGVDCIVCKDHEILFRHYEGMADIEEQIPLSEDNLYLIYSMTKLLTCTAALQLWEKGAYSLEDPICKYLPEFSTMRISDTDFDGKKSVQITTGGTDGEKVCALGQGCAKNLISIRHLFTMSGGLDYDIQSEAIRKALAAGKKSTRELVSAMSETVLGFEPGTRFRYSLCHDVLGALIEIWSGEKLSIYMKKNIFEPLGMKNSFFGIPEEEAQLSRMTAKYRFNEKKYPVREPLKCPYIFTPDYECGGAGMTSCTEDYALFLDALACGGMGSCGNRILGADTIAMMASNQFSGQALEDFHEWRPGYGYGLGVRVHMTPSESGSMSPIGEFGWDGAGGAFSMVDPVNHISLTYFQHAANWDLKIQNELRNALYADL